MKNAIVVAAACLSLLGSLAGAASAQLSLEALKAGGLPSSLGRQGQAPEIGRAAQVSAFDGGEYRSEAEARRALDAALLTLRQAGLAVVGARTVAPGGGSKGYSLHIDYLDSVGAPGTPPRKIESYVSGGYPSSYAASNALSASVSNLAAAGYLTLRAQALARDGRWVYEVDYVRGRQAPVRQSFTFTSGYYLQNFAAIAQRDMMAAIYNLQAQGATIVSYGVFPVWGTPYCVYQIRYLGR